MQSGVPMRRANRQQGTLMIMHKVPFGRGSAGLHALAGGVLHEV